MISWGQAFVLAACMLFVTGVILGAFLGVAMLLVWLTENYIVLAWVFGFVLAVVMLGFLLKAIDGV